MPSGGENGFNQAIELSAETLANVKFVQEKRLISRCGLRHLGPRCWPVLAGQTRGKLRGLPH